MLIKEIVVRTVTVCVNHFLGEAPRIVRVNVTKQKRNRTTAAVTQQYNNIRSIIHRLP